jgi:hypothetical protein
MKSGISPSATERFKEGKAAVAEMQQRKSNHEQEIETREDELRSRKARLATASITERAEAFFKNADAGKDTRTLESELQALREQAPLYDVQIERLEAEASRLRRDHTNHFYAATIRDRDIRIKTDMAREFILLATACDAEASLIDEMVQADAMTPKAFRSMSPPFIGRLSDKSSFVEGWLRELREHYPDLKIER